MRSSSTQYACSPKLPCPPPSGSSAPYACYQLTTQLKNAPPSLGPLHISDLRIGVCLSCPLQCRCIVEPCLLCPLSSQMVGPRCETLDVLASISVRLHQIGIIHCCWSASIQHPTQRQLERTGRRTHGKVFLLICTFTDTNHMIIPATSAMVHGLVPLSCFSTCAARMSSCWISTLSVTSRTSSSFSDFEALPPSFLPA